MNWHLFLDESGNFDAPDDEVVVAGILLREDAPGCAEDQLLRRFRQHLAHVPWPPHTAHLQHPVARVVWHAAARDGGAGWGAAPEKSRAAYDKAVEVLEESAPDALAEAQRQALLDEGHGSDSLGRIDWELMGRFENLLAEYDLEQGTDLLGQFESDAICDVREFRRGIMRAFAGESVGHDGEGGEPAPAYVTAVSESWRGDAEAKDSDRYLVLLEQLVERVEAVLKRLGGEHQVHLRPLGRHVKPDGGAQRPMRGEDLSGLIERVVRQRNEDEQEQNDASVSVVADGVAEWAYEMDSRLAAADFVANQLRRIASDFLSLEDFEENLALRVGVPARWRDAGVTTLAAGPTVAERLEQAMSEKKGADEFIESLKIFGRIQEEVMAPWTYEQAAEWL